MYGLRSSVVNVKKTKLQNADKQHQLIEFDILLRRVYKMNPQIQLSNTENVIHLAM